MRTQRRWLIAALLTLAVVLGVGLSLSHPAASAEPSPLPVVVIDPAAPLQGPSLPEPADRLVRYTGPIEHIFFHPLIAYPELAFDGSPLARGYDDWMVTVSEFDKIIDSVYSKGFMLVSFADLFETQTTDGQSVIVRRELWLPPGKKPLILSIDDLNYYQYMREHGNVYKLVLDDAGRIATFSVTPQGENRVAYDNDIVPILDAFVAAHPDFSWHGAKGLINLTGYEGILGYRTNDTAAPGYAQEKQDALRVVGRLKETGWSFASHSWGHLDMAKVSYRALVVDTTRWKNEVEPLIGPTAIYVYPFGSTVPLRSDKLAYLQSEGFRIFCGVGPDPYTGDGGSFVLMDRRHIDGVALRTQRLLNASLFDAAAVIDPVRPKR